MRYLALLWHAVRSVVIMVLTIHGGIAFLEMYRSALDTAEARVTPNSIALERAEHFDVSVHDSGTLLGYVFRYGATVSSDSVVRLHTFDHADALLIIEDIDQVLCFTLRDLHHCHSDRPNSNQLARQ